MDDRPGWGAGAPPLDQRERDQYLTFGFVPELPPDGDPLALLGDWSRPPRRGERSVSEAALVREGVRALRAALGECAVAAQGPGDQVVLLSGGLDSRAILGALLENYRPGEVLAATFGAPGEHDFDVAATVARAVGVRHEVLESSAVDWTTDGLVDSVLARQIPLPHPFGQRYLSYRLHQRIGPDNTFWDGLCGDVTGGANTHEGDDRATWEEAVAGFLDLHLLPDWEQYTSPGFGPASTMPAAPFVSDAVLTYPDQLMFAVRQTRYINTRRLRGYTIRTPFLSRPWLDFMLSVPIRYRRDRRLYMTIVRKAHPRLFRLPTTTFDGVGVPAPPWLRPARVLQRRAVRKIQRRSGTGGKPDSGANNAIRRSHRHRPDIRELILGNLGDLAGRGVVPGLDPDAIARAMTERTISDTRLSVLLGVEVNLKAVDRLAETGVEPRGSRRSG
ncbi:Asparagine synthase [Modestobacter sp. DSM 44400]|uniref:asparagine synthase-related protein n=1 Tax=Modestobacter sp. DSM 44400 TaxID=1550230 RepID=UPI000899FF72|nr:asparagine synthase-related protein [Modestobacter sp. DSM 44400]SDX84058.1 Asparagine synthase [Modestobacter sp. DSM 44400]